MVVCLMPLTDKGKTIKAAMQKKYGTKRGERVFHASRNSGTIKGVDRPSMKAYMHRRRKRR